MSLEFELIYYIIFTFELMLRYYSLFDEIVDVILSIKNKTLELMSYPCYGFVILFLNICNLDHSDLID